MLRSAASPGSRGVRPARKWWEWPPHITISSRPPFCPTSTVMVGSAATIFAAESRHGRRIVQPFSDNSISVTAPDGTISRVADDRRRLAFALRHVFERVLTRLEADVVHAFGKRFQPRFHRRRIVAQHVQAGIEGDDLDFDFLALAGIVQRDVLRDIERGVHLVGVVVAHLQREPVRLRDRRQRRKRHQAK